MTDWMPTEGGNEGLVQFNTGETTEMPSGLNYRKVRVVESVPKNSNFEFGYNGFEFYTLKKSGECVAIRPKRN